VADGRHVENHFLAITLLHNYCPIETKFGVPGLNRTHTSFGNENVKFRKSNMAGGRHFENQYISISQPQIFRVARNLVCRHKFYCRRQKRQKNQKFTNSKWRMDGALKIIFGYNSAACCPIKMKFGVRRQNHTHTKLVTSQVIKCLFILQVAVV